MKYVISLGGSIINPGKIDIGFLKDFKGLVERQVEKGDRFFIITGGGKLTRDYQAAARKMTDPADEDLDWLGVATTKPNAELTRTIFSNIAYGKVMSDPTEKISTRKPLIVYSGWKPGWSTDYDAVKVASTHNVKTVVNLSNIDFVYDKDPKKHSHARKFERMSWDEFLKLFDSREPGGNYPFDPVAAKLAHEKGITAVILNGTNLDNFLLFLDGNKYTGTIIAPRN